MGGQKSKQNIPKKTTALIPTPTPIPTVDVSAILETLSGAVYPRQRTLENFLIIWLDAAIDKSNKERWLTQLRGVVNEVNIFTEPGQCIQFLNGIEEEKVFIITSGSLSKNIVPNVHALPQLEAIYLFCWQKDLHEEWTKRWNKVKGVHTSIHLICQALQEAAKECNQDSIAITFVLVGEGVSNDKIKELDPSFKYTQILKEILPEISNDDKYIQILVEYCREVYKENTAALAVINEFDSSYRSKSPIWWYTRPCFIYQMLNRALRTLEEDITIYMGFFIRDLHQQIEQLYQQQVPTYPKGPFTVYRGQGLSKEELEKLLKREGGLMSFDGFLSASTSRDASMKFATNALSKTEKAGVLFKINLNPSVTSIPFASIREFSYTKTEEDILFSIHTVFRVSKITKMDNNKPLYQVDLQPALADDLELRKLTELIQEDVEDEKGWCRLGAVLIKLRELDKAERFCTRLLEQTSDLGERANCYWLLGYIKAENENYEEGVEYCEKALEISEQIPPPNDFYLINCYENFCHVYQSQNEYSEALSYCQKVLEIREKSLPPDHVDFFKSYLTIAFIHTSMDEHSDALPFYHKTLEILEKNHPPKYSNIALTYEGIATTYLVTEDYPNALSFFQKALENKEKTIPPNYQDIAETYDDIGTTHAKMEEHETALTFHAKALEVRKKCLASDDPEIVASYHKLAQMYQKLKQYPEALSFYEQELEILLKFLPENHSHLGMIYHEICVMHQNMRDFRKAIAFEEKSLKTWQAMPEPDPCLMGIIYQHIGRLYRELKDYSKALSHYEKAAELFEEIDVSTHPDIVKAYSDIGGAYSSMGDYPKALSYYLRSLEIEEQRDPTNTKLGYSYEAVGFMYKNVKQYEKALEYYERAKEMYTIEHDSTELHLKGVAEIPLKNLEANINFAKKKLQNSLSNK